MLQLLTHAFFGTMFFYIDYIDNKGETDALEIFQSGWILIGLASGVAMINLCYLIYVSLAPILNLFKQEKIDRVHSASSTIEQDDIKIQNENKISPKKELEKVRPEVTPVKEKSDAEAVTTENEPLKTIEPKPIGDPESKIEGLNKSESKRSLSKKKDSIKNEAEVTEPVGTLTKKKTIRSKQNLRSDKEKEIFNEKAEEKTALDVPDVILNPNSSEMTFKPDSTLDEADRIEQIRIKQEVGESLDKLDKSHLDVSGVEQNSLVMLLPEYNSGSYYRGSDKSSMGSSSKSSSYYPFNPKQNYREELDLSRITNQQHKNFKSSLLEVHKVGEDGFDEPLEDFGTKKGHIRKDFLYQNQNHYIMELDKELELSSEFDLFDSKKNNSQKNNIRKNPFEDEIIIRYQDPKSKNDPPAKRRRKFSQSNYEENEPQKGDAIYI